MLKHYFETCLDPAEEKRKKGDEAWSRIYCGPTGAAGH
jgi:hypothetical protein